ncbi:MAG: hypothetical protein JSW33_01990 [bacterium]|nr:MAG: hypothetical protein JSW33_01990 [bacterium]
MIKLEIRVKILPYKRIEFIQAVKNICSLKSVSDPVTSLIVCQHLNDENIFNCTGEWDSREKLDNYMKSITYEMLIGAMQVLGEIQQAQIHDIHTTDEFGI